MVVLKAGEATNLGEIKLRFIGEEQAMNWGRKSRTKHVKEIGEENLIPEEI